MVTSPVDHRAHPEEYRIGRGEQGVFQVEPYRSELLPLWRFATPELARESSAAITAAFERDLADEDFVGADMARKYLQMGYTRWRRYARHRGGRKDHELPPDQEDPVKAESARIFKAAWDEVAADATYRRLKAQHQRRRR